MKKKTAGVFLLFVFSMFLFGCGKAEETYLEEAVIESEAPETEAVEEPKRIFVYVCGAVQSPGVYELDSGARIYEAVEKAGGLRPDAAQTAVNQAEVLTDGMQITVPTEEEAASGGAGASIEVDDGLVNINTADVNLLMTLPGIGESKAGSIISYREEHGAFSDITELKNIPGIKDGVFSKIKDKIKV